MASRVMTIIQIALTISLTVGLVLSASSWALPHSPAGLDSNTHSIITAQHGAEIAKHVHSHGEVDSHHEVDNLSLEIDGHAHNAADHDHNITYLFPHTTSSVPTLGNARWLLASVRLWQGPAFNLDKPPRG